MANPPNIVRAVHKILSDPPASADAIRNTAADDIKEIGPSVFVESRPQNSPDLGIVVGVSGGRINSAVNRPSVCGQYVVDISTYFKNRTSRENSEKAQRISELIAILFTSFRGTVSTDVNVEIIDSLPEVPPFQRDVRPQDASDDWHTHIVSPIMFTFKTLRPTTV